MVDYVCNQRTSEREYPNGIRDLGRGSLRLSYFTSHVNARRANLEEAEVAAQALQPLLPTSWRPAIHRGWLSRSKPSQSRLRTSS